MANEIDANGEFDASAYGYHKGYVAEKGGGGWNGSDKKVQKSSMKHKSSIGGSLASAGRWNSVVGAKNKAKQAADDSIEQMYGQSNNSKKSGVFATYQLLQKFLQLKSRII